MIHINPWAYYYLALLVLLVPLPWLLAAASAAFFHELCHIAAIYLVGDTIYRIDIRPLGAVIEASFSGKGRELLAALAGPAGSFSLLLFCHVWPELSLCGFAQGIFNLLPIYPLDGGRALRCGLALLRRKIPCKGRENAVQ